MGLFDLFKNNGSANEGLPDGNAEDIRGTAMLNYSLAETYSAQGDTVHARNYYLHAIENIRELAEKGKDVSDLQLLYRAYALTGEIYRKEGDFAKAADFWSKAFATEKTLLEVEPDDPGHYSSAGISSQWSGYCFDQAGDFHKAYMHYGWGLEIIRDAEKNRFGQVFTYEDTDCRTFDLFRAEACINIARLQNEHYDELFDAEDVYNICSECVESLFHMENLEPTEDRKYDTIMGTLMCADYVDPGRRHEFMDLAASLCDTALKTCENRMRFLKLQKKITAGTI